MKKSVTGLTCNIAVSALLQVLKMITELHSINQLIFWLYRTGKKSKVAIVIKEDF